MIATSSARELTKWARAKSVGEEEQTRKGNHDASHDDAAPVLRVWGRN